VKFYNNNNKQSLEVNNNVYYSTTETQAKTFIVLNNYMLHIN